MAMRRTIPAVVAPPTDATGAGELMFNCGEAEFVVKAVSSYKSVKPDELSFKKNARITVTKTDEKSFRYYGKLDNGKQGWFPCLYGKARSTNLTETDAAGKLKKLVNSALPSKNTKEEPDRRQDRSRSVCQPPRDEERGKRSVWTKIVPEYSSPKKPVELEQVIKTGMLQKQSRARGKLSKPQSIWVVLSRTTISFFRSAGIKKPLGTVATRNITKLAADREEDGIFWFSLQFKEKVVYFGCESSDEREEWILQISLAGSIARSTKGERKSSALQETPRVESNNPPAPLPRGKRKSRMDVIKLVHGDRVLKKILAMEADEGEMALEENLSPRGVKVNSPRMLKLSRENSGLHRNRYSIALSQDFDNEEEETEEEFDKNQTRYLARVRATADYLSTSENVLSFGKFETFMLIERKQENGWWLGEHNGCIGFFPSAFVEIYGEYNNPDKEPSDEPLTISDLGDGDRVGKFSLMDILGKTALNGTKYTAVHNRTTQKVAVIQYPAALFTRDMRNSVIRKINQLAGIQHPYLVSHKGAIRGRKFFNVVTSFVPGESLSEMVERFGKFSEQAIIPFIRQILEALQLLHGNNVIHGRVRANNITKDTATGNAILGEQGFVELLSTEGSTITSEPYWLAPEILLQQNLSVALDIWALGCTIIELLTGKPPFGNLPPLQASFAIVEEETIPIPANISYPMRTFLQSCFTKKAFCRATPRELLLHPIFQSNNVDMDAPDDSHPEDTEDSLEIEADIEMNVEKDPEEEEFENNTKAAREILGWFIDALDTQNVSYAIQIRKAIRDKRKELREFKDNERYDDFRKELRKAMERCEDEMGEHIPVDSDDDDDDYYSEDSDEFYDESDFFT